MLGWSRNNYRRIKHNAGMSDQAKCAVSMRCADRIVMMCNLDGRSVNNQQGADDPKENTPGALRAGWRLLPGHDVWLKSKIRD